MTKEESIKKFREAIESFEEVRMTEEDVYSALISTKELHEFLTIEGKGLASQKCDGSVLKLFKTLLSLDGSLPSFTIEEQDVCS